MILDRILIVDTSYLMYRSYFGYPNLTHQNQPIGAFFGFAKTVVSLINQYKPSSLVFAMDTPKPTFRHQQLDTYKAGRPEIQDNMRVQIPIIKEWCSKITKDLFEVEGFEADDLIFTVTKNILATKSSEVYIFSSDKDLYQLLELENVFFIQNKDKNQLTDFTKEEFVEKYQLQPCQWLDYKALVGDGSDNLKGIAGIGPKTATSLLQSIGHIGNIFEFMRRNKNLLGSEVYTDLYQKFESLEVEVIPDNNDNDSDLFNQVHIEKLTTEATEFKVDEAFLQQNSDLLFDFIKESKNRLLISKFLENYKELKQIYHLANLQIVPNITLSKENFDLNKGLADLQKYEFTSITKTLIKNSQPEIESLF